ncbi:DUF2391 family protein [Halorubrum sp. DTA98]|uniref:DUF2391 family protein n=1 Tax=Halorubrum sp. DTA98 TaxID=3402163 RepID=UPI003AAA73B6
MTGSQHGDGGRGDAPDVPTGDNSKPSGNDGPNGNGGPNGSPENPNIDDLLDKLDALEATVDDDAERRKVRQTIALVERMPGSKAFTTRISKYTTRDIAESFVGAVIFSLPLLVEDGVFEIAEWFLATAVAGVPVFFLANVAFVLGMTAGLLYYADFREIEITNPILGFVPRRYVGVLVVSLCTAFFMLLLWGRLHSGDPTTMEQLSRVTVIWVVAAFGAALGDILPGESSGEDISQAFE